MAMMRLPIDAVLPQLTEVLARQNAAVLTAEPGAGKTTRVPLALLGCEWLGQRKIVMLEPRRIAARAAARHMAELRGEKVGETVGYSVRLERRTSPRTRIEVVTEGLLTRRLQGNPVIEDTGCVIFDEFHERTLDGDLGLALALDIQRGLRPDLRLLVMSATLDAAKLADYLGGAPLISAPGRLYPVATRYTKRPKPNDIAAELARTVSRALAEHDGSVLAFLPGEAEIRRSENLLTGGELPGDVEIRPLFGAMPAEAQDQAIRPASRGRRKIVLATTIAETSLTIDGISVVVDSGYKRRPGFDPSSGMTRLDTVRVSLASAEQRRGRAGRLGPGLCYRMWPEAEDRALIPFDPPEMLGADLASLALDLAAWGIGDPAQLSWIDPPPGATFAQARELLRKLDAVDDAGHITEMGKAMAALPLHPRLAHLVIAGDRLGAGALAADLAALLSEHDILERGGDADIALRIEALRSQDGGANRGARERVREASGQIRRIAGIGSREEPASIGILIALAWPERVAQRRGACGRFRMAQGGGAALPDHDALARRDYLAVATTDGKPGDQRIFLAARIEKAEIEQHFAARIEKCDVIAWDRRSRSVTATRQRRLDALVLEEAPLPGADPNAVATALIAGIREEGVGSLPWSDAARRFQARVSFLRRLVPDEGWPDLSDEALMSRLDIWLEPYLAGMTRLQHLAPLKLHEILRSQVPQSLQRKLDRLAPTRIAIPSGAEITVDYGVDGDPILRARLQEMFGLASTPRIGDGRVPLRIELLSPAGRPLAVTQSLETFWTNAYPHVRAEMRGRYPKHAWPEDPRNAVAVKPGRVR